MSFSKPPSYHIAAPVIGQMDFLGLINNIILLEYDDNDNALRYLAPVLKNKATVIFSPEKDDMHAIYGDEFHLAGLEIDSVTKGSRWIKKLGKEKHTVDYYILHRVDLMDIHAHPKARGANLKGQLSLVGNERILQGANIIVTSGQCEFGVRSIADRFIDLK